jgi:fucose 4-O-acetylase-like acetyltransferase
MNENTNNSNNSYPSTINNISDEALIHKPPTHHLRNSLRHYIEDLHNRINSRNKQMDIMRAFGIICIIWGHNYQPPFLFFPAFYALALFFFVSGYFFIPQITIKDKFTYFLKKTRKQLIPYLILNFFFGLLTMWLRQMGFNFGLDLNLQTLLIHPFGRGDQFVLYLAAWFIFNLYFISIFAGLVYQKSKKINIYIVILSIIMMCIFLLFTYDKPNVSMWTTFLSRSAFGFAFFSIGYLFHVYESKIQNLVVRPINIIILYLLFDVLSKNLGDIYYDILFGNVNNPIVIVPIFTTLCIIFIVYIITFYLKNILNKHSFIYLIGQHTFSIMVWHLTCFFLVNLMFYKLLLIPFSNISDVYFRYNIEKLWVVYQLPAIILPLLLVEIYYFIKQKSFLFFTKISSKSTTLVAEQLPT